MPSKDRYLKSCQSPFWKRVLKKETEYLIKELKGYKKVLSVGCGPAMIERTLKEKGFEVTGLDISKEALQAAPNAIKKVIGSAENMVFRAKSFDAVIYVTSLQFIKDYRKAIEETARVIRPNGKLIVMLLNPESYFFKERIKRQDSYIASIKHKSIKPIEQIISKRFTISTQYYLGIKETKIFNTSEKNLASLYVIKGVTKIPVKE